MRIVVDTSVFVNAVLGREGSASRQVLRHCLLRELQPMMGIALFLEYEDVTHRPELTKRSPLTATEIDELLDAFASVCQWTNIYYLWRPNLTDEGDHHLLELAVASGAEAIVTQNVRHLRSGELQFPQIQILRPADLLKEL
ncbi:MAG: putative toxin-antitoxin system toxin component, PIN family [Acidobacteriota bacterium]|nr:putative toxin-antitoxin system toxin component, PIN family [Acidobacteriota bacterium]